MEIEKTGNYEIRALNQKGKCYLVRTFSKEKEATISFGKMCNKMQGLHDVAKDNALAVSVLAHEYQLVTFNDAMTSFYEAGEWHYGREIREIKTWRPAQ